MHEAGLVGQSDHDDFQAGALGLVVLLQGSLQEVVLEEGSLRPWRQEHQEVIADLVPGILI